VWLWLAPARHPPPATLQGGGLVLAALAINSAIGSRLRR
jgi:hypothetical protein